MQPLLVLVLLVVSSLAQRIKPPLAYHRGHHASKLIAAYNPNSALQDSRGALTTSEGRTDTFNTYILKASEKRCLMSASPPTVPLDVGMRLFSNALYGPLFLRQCQLADTSSDFPEDASLQLLDTYDAVVVGAGSSGSVVAARLSENPDWKVLLLEAGGDPPFVSQVPGLWVMMLGGDPKYTWQLQLEPQEHVCKGFLNGRCSWGIGKMLGGSDSHNGMIYLRGRKADYEKWASMGNEGWSYEDVLPYFRKSEKATSKDILSLPNALKYHGTEGELEVILPNASVPVVEAIQIGAKKNSFQYIIDLNRGDAPGTGYGFAQLNIKDGTRCSSAKGLLGTSKGRKNLHVVRNAVVSKVLIDPKSRQAVGVKFSLNGELKEVNIAKEIVISGGSILSPQLLMLSGIGPKDHLSELGIPQIMDLPVGYNLMDHPIYMGLVFCFQKGSLQIPGFMDSAYQYLKYRSGYLSAVGSTSFVIFARTKFADKSNYEPDIEISFLISTDFFPLQEEFSRHKADIKSSVDELSNKYDIVIPTIYVIQPKSSGRITLNSSKETVPPRINPRYLSDAADVNVLVDGIRIAASIGENIPNIANVTNIKTSACPHETMTEDYWRCSLKYFTIPSLHAVGSNKMGSERDTSSVVDPRLRVRGVKGLRVADASIMPYIPRGNTNAACFMVGEKAAQMIKEDWSNDVSQSYVRPVSAE